MGTPKDLLARFWGKVDQSGGPTACWPWLGAFNRPKGPGSRRPVFWVGRLGALGSPQVLVYAPRFALSLTDGVSLDERVGLQARHLCHAPEGNCCNPAHLQWGTDEENRDDRYRHARKDRPARDFGGFC